MAAILCCALVLPAVAMEPFNTNVGKSRSKDIMWLRISAEKQLRGMPVFRHNSSFEGSGFPPRPEFVRLPQGIKKVIFLRSMAGL